MQKSPNDVDRHIGKRIRARRIAVNLSQEKLAEALGLTFQQVQKYEKGINRVGASRLLHIAQILGVEIDHFFKGLPETAGLTGSIDNVFEKVIDTAEGVRLLEAFATVEDIQIQRKIVDLVELVLELKRVAPISQKH